MICTPFCFFLSFLLYGQHGANALHLAAYGDHMEIVKYLIPKFGDRRFDLDNAGHTCLNWAAQKGHLAVVKYLVEECGFNPNLGNKVSCCVCVYSVCCFHIQCCMYLTLCDVSQS